MKKLGYIILVALSITACNPETKSTDATKVKQVNSTASEVPSFFEISVTQNVKWKESSVFSYEGMELRGTEGKIGILSVPWKAGVRNKYMWHFFGNNIPTGQLTVVAVKKGTNEVRKVLLIPDSDKQEWTSGRGGIPASSQNHSDLPAEMVLPSKGLWVLNAYIGGELFGQIVVDVQ
ncbi:DUF4871 domain-containing protein [Ectobacillus sp. JY-23]|uniref:DUF4871 domain-containing protein n=1 Tax=Ectobacillus sp. JY-23 TaxID=2933872 RepID=UPI001FF45700|nr:DUF4871 domain-containing protein [Ectobacillus sp. JY-23]UOY92806.1 DUF4871 domain-containing protein [Ectobacillus sp. JY-23]